MMMYRSYQLIATASKDHYVRIFKLTESNAPNQPFNMSPRSPPQKSNQGTSTSGKFGQHPLHIELVAAFNDHHAEVRSG